MGNRREQSVCFNALGAVLYLQGRWEESIAALERGIRLAQSFGGTFGEVIGAHRLGLVETALGRYEAAHARLRDALGAARQSENTMVRAHSMGRLLTALARNRHEAGDLPTATEYLALGVATPHEVGECPGCDVLLYPVAVPIYLALGDLGQADAACRKAETTAATYDSPAWLADARYLRGLVAAAQGRGGESAAALQDAHRSYEALGQPYDAARALEALATVAASAPAGTAVLEPDATALRRRAAALYERLGAAGDLPRLEGAAPSREPVRS